ncbi:MAG TPA: UMP kinase [Methanomassiliicoccales archaeon]|nr:UMP kinase [Methanomassiliicoccales archaeon]HPR97713.1 UMP kinase [Methanomassiliicoccales archaeon]HSA35723.1 UMP kinase [Methanomassiliicoccales archaeon]
MDKIVVSLGGSVIVPDDNDDAFLKRFSEMISSLCDRYQIYLVCGGGKIARYYIKVGRSLGLTEYDLDEMGILSTRINAALVAYSLGDISVGKVPTDILEAHRLEKKGKVVVMGGTVPGHTTDAVSAMLAKEVKAVRIINGTSVDAAYTADPKKDPHAERLSKITHQQLYELVNVGMHGAGPSNVFDRLGAQIARDGHISISIVDGRDIEEMRAAIEGRPIKGTVVSD